MSSNKALNAMAFVGRAKGYYQAVVGALVGLILSVVASLMISSGMSNKKTQKTTAVLSNVQCTSHTETTTDSKGNVSSRVVTRCTAQASYRVDGTPHVANLEFNETQVEGNVVTIYYDPANPSDASGNAPISPVIGWVILCVAVIVAVGGIVWAYLLNRHKTLATISGTASTFGVIRDIL